MRLPLHPTAAIVSALAAAGFPRAPAADWPAWRGPTGDGVSPEEDLPLRWSETEGVRWKTPLPEPGSSTPIVWGDRVLLTQAVERGHDLLREHRRRATALGPRVACVVAEHGDARFVEGRLVGEKAAAAVKAGSRAKSR